jgi:hypothetical protein
LKRLTIKPWRLTLELQRLTLELWRLTVELWRITRELFFIAPLKLILEAWIFYPGTEEAHSRAIEAHPGTMKASHIARLILE